MPHAAGLYYEEHGPAGAPPVILSPGLGGSANYWTPNLAALTDAHRIILYDHRGTGRSDRSPTGAFPMAAWGRDMLFLMDELGIERATIIGHAAGGIAGLALASLAPKRVDRLIVVNGWAKPDPHFQRCFDVRLALLRSAGVRDYLRAQPIFLYPANWISEKSALLDAELEHQIASFPLTEVLEARITALRGFDIAANLQRIQMPTLLIAAEDDMLVPNRCSEVLLAGLPNASLVRMLGGHACNVTDPSTFNRIVLDFLGS